MANLAIGALNAPHQNNEKYDTLVAQDAVFFYTFYLKMLKISSEPA